MVRGGAVETPLRILWYSSDQRAHEIIQSKVETF